MESPGSQTKYINTDLIFESDVAFAKLGDLFVAAGFFELSRTEKADVFRVTLETPVDQPGPEASTRLFYISSNRFLAMFPANG